jgi:hypothetical protein
MSRKTRWPNEPVDRRPIRQPPRLERVGTSEYALKRERAVNFGDRARVVGGNRVPLGQIAREDVCEGHTIFAQAKLIALGPAPIPFTVVPRLAIEWGNGGSSVGGEEYDCIYRLRVPVVASTISITGFLIDTATGQPPASSSIAADFSGFIAPGIDTSRLFPSTWIGADKVAGALLAVGQQRLCSLRGFVVSAGAPPPAPMFIQVADQGVPLAGPGSQVVDEAVTDASGAFAFALGETRGFMQGIAVAISSTPFVFTAPPPVTLGRFVAELML